MSGTTSDIFIAGGGIPGLTLAVLLAEAGLSVAVADPALPGTVAHAAADTRTSALMQAGINILHAAGVWEACRAQGGLLRTMTIVDDSAAPPVELAFAAAEIDQELFGINVPNAVLLAALREKAAALPAIARLPAAVASHDADAFGVTVNLKGGASRRARLLVGADGRHSTVRDGAGITARLHDYGQTAITCLIEHSLPHQDESVEFHRPSGPFTLVPLPGTRSSVVWVDFHEAADEFMAMNKTSFRQALQDRSRGRRGEIALAAPPQAWTLIGLKAARLTAPRVALAAEAAHVLHPLGAQGLNLSLRDVAALAETIVDAVRLGQDFGSAAVLGLYESRRRGEVASRAFGTDALNLLVSTPSGARRTLRRAGLAALRNVSALKDLAMRQGMAPLDAQGRLARGLPL